MVKYYFLLFILSWLHYCQGTSVSVITDDGKDTLSGSYCPTTVKLICNVTNFPHLRWTYNTSKNIIVIFNSDSVVRYPIAAFPFYQLTQFNVYKNHMNRTLINASTILTVDLSDLNKQNIEIISCGFSALDKTVPVNISILQPSFPSVSPQVYTAVIVCYESGLVSSVDISWRKFQQPDCPEYENSQEYLINVTGCGWMWLNHSTCQDNICSSVFSNCTENLSEITLQANVADIESEQVVYPTSVDYYNQYFRPAVNQSSRCQIHVQCLPIHRYFRGNQKCTIRYTTDPEYGNLSNPIINPVGTIPVLLSRITPGAMYYFEFSVLVNDTLLITERIEYITESGELFQLGAREGVIIAIASVFLGCFTVHTIIILCLNKGHPTVSRFISNKHIQFLMTLILFMFFIACGTLLTTFAINSNDVCLLNEEVPNKLLDAMLVLSCVGIGILLLYWVFRRYKIYRQHTKGTKNKLENTTSHCDYALHPNTSSQRAQYNAQESPETPDSQECQQLHPEGVNEMVPMPKKPSNGSQLMTTPSRKCPPSTLPKQRKLGQHSNTVLYDEVGLAKIKGNVSDMTEVELKANESYGHIDKRFSTAKNNVTACPLCSTPASKIQQDLSLSHQYSEIKAKPKGEHPELNAIEQEQIELKCNQSYCQLTSAVGQIGGCEPLHEYDYIYVDS
ncbi:uncharacterized protein LOC135351213 isoform X2 [Halichondria panicea]|uniref:uncharacterized protein LOC135351213 isoform X2 n=1 Tax=Halichondria panicea TaxID=6063 RepID=UPI00312B3EE9